MENGIEKRMKFPPQIDPVSGRFRVSQGAQAIRESVYIILMTQKTERWLRPSFGSSIVHYTFTDANNTMLNIMARELTEDITRGEPRVENVNIRFDAKSKEGCLLVYTEYTIREDGIRDGLVFPFYLNDAEDSGERW